LEPILVIDFGTAYSCAALVTGDQVELIHEPSSGLLAWPSAVLVDGADILTGSPAERRKVVRAPFYRSEIKRHLSRGDSLGIGGADYEPESLVSAILAAFRSVADKVNGGPVAHAVLTKPADYLPGDPRNDRMISAGEAAGFSLVELLPEPSAAAYSAPAGEEFAPGSMVLVYDWGGGTFDTALVQVLADGSEILASDGLPYCGGVDIDAAVARYLCEQDPELSALFASGEKGRLAVLDLADRLKREVSERPDSLQEAVGIEAALGVADFEKIAQPFVERTVECCRELVSAAGCGAEDLDAILIAGGCSRIPLVGRMLRTEFSLEPRSARDPELAIVRGAARWAAQSASRCSGPLAVESGIKPLQWPIPGGSAKLVDWLVAESAPYEENATLARVRLPDGTIWSLKADAASVLRTQHARIGTHVESGYWLATTDTGAEPLKPLKRVFGSRYAGFGGLFRGRNGGISLLSDSGLVYLMTDSECYALDPSSNDLRLLCNARELGPQAEIETETEPPTRRFFDLELGKKGSLRILVGVDRESAKWVEIDRRTGAFLRQGSK
jgi:molecular chaperone DnaK